MAPKVTDTVSDQSHSVVFQCQQCGDCCSGRGGIFVKPDEVEAMAALLNLAIEEFCRRFVEASAMGPRLTIAANGFCIFLMEGNLCRVHPVKPFICRQWPFLPALLVNADELEHAKTACPGINPACSHADFVDAALNNLSKDRAMTNDLHYFMFFVGRLFQGAEMMIKHSEYIEADESNLMYDFVSAREATREALKDAREFLEKFSARDDLKTKWD